MRVSPEVFFVVLQTWAFAVSLAIGSFLNVCIARMPQDRSVVSPGSMCPSCGHKIPWYENIPVLSWVFLRGRCSACGTKISALYPGVELLMGVLGLLLFRRLVPDLASVDAAHLAAWGIFTVFVAMQVANTFIDQKHRILPDELTIYAAPFGVLAALLLSYLGYQGHLAINWQQSVVGALAGSGVLLLLIGGYWLVRRVQGMGFGDVKLLLAFGAFLGIWSVLPILMIASLVGLAVGIPMMLARGQGMRLELPFGPFLVAGAMVWVYFGTELMAWWIPYGTLASGGL